jgi:predicted ATPase
MGQAQLTSVAIENFKSYRDRTEVSLGLLTVVVGRNNSGKSSVIQALLLLKQTLESARLDVPLRLEGPVEAFSLRELTYGWPDESDALRGPAFEIGWESTIDVKAALRKLDEPDLFTLASNADLMWLLNFENSVRVQNRIRLEYGEQRGAVYLRRIELVSKPLVGAAKRAELKRDVTEPVLVKIVFDKAGEGYSCRYNGTLAKRLDVSLEHFIPFVAIDRRNVGPRHTERSWANAFYLLFVESLEDLKRLIKGFSFLSSTRALPKPIYGPSPTEDVGISGEMAAQLLQAHQTDFVHYLAPDFTNPSVMPEFRELPLVDAVHDVFRALGVDAKVSIEEIKNAGFRLLFGKANLQHVGRGFTYLLPLVELGLVSDPQRFSKLDSPEKKAADLSLSVCAFEEPEAHLHPKVQTRLAHWFVALAMGQRQVIVETHSDHLVRRLRSLVVQATEGSEVEQWLLKHVTLVHVEQNDGLSCLTTTRLTRDGKIENWPSDFMDESVESEQEIYLAALDKTPAAQLTASVFEHKEEREPSEGAP